MGNFPIIRRRQFTREKGAKFSQRCVNNCQPLNFPSGENNRPDDVRVAISIAGEKNRGSRTRAKASEREFTKTNRSVKVT